MRDARCLPGAPLREGKIVGWNARVFSIFLAFGTEPEPTPLSREYAFCDLAVFGFFQSESSPLSRRGSKGITVEVAVFIIDIDVIHGGGAQIKDPDVISVDLIEHEGDVFL